MPQDRWRDRDSGGAQRQLGEALALLSAGCEYRILRQKGGLETNDNTVWLEIEWKGFGYFDWGGGLDDDTFYLPTRARLDRANGGDWY